MNFNHYQNLGWNLWVNPYWNALATHNAYYYYQSAKAALSSQYQTTMVRKGGGTKRPYSNGHRVETVPALPPATHRGDDFSSETSLTQFGIKNCPECRRVFEETNRSVLENCMHVKCRICFIEHSEGCLQCKNEAESERPKKALRSALTSSPSVTSTIFQTRKGPTPTTFGSSTQVAFPVTISTLIGQNAPPAGKTTRSTTLRSTINSNGSTTEPTNHSTYTITSGSSRVIRRPPDPPSPPLQALPKVRQTYGKSSATNKVPNRGAVLGGAAPVQGHSGLNTTFTHINADSSNAAVSKTNGTAAGPSTSFQVSKPVHAQEVTNGGSVSNRSSNVSNASSGPTRYPVPARVPSSSMPKPSPDENEPEPDSILGDLNVETTAPSTENRVNKKKRHPVHIHDHISIVSGDPLLYQCNVCMKKFKTKAHIKYHEFCQNGEKPFKCEQCGQGFIAKSHYEYHIRTHTGERPYVCPKCGKGFNQRGKVTRHMRSHTGEKPFVCQQCGRGFANAQAMRSHFLIHTGERPFACEFCDKRFTGMTNLKKHVITHTGERPFQCSHCGKSFGLKWTLDLHLRTHSSERPYACDQCSRAFSNSKDLRRHMVIHSGERPFKCWICGTAFRRKDNLDRHIKNTHNQTREVAKQLANEAAAEYLASSTSASSASTSTSSSQTSTPKPATVSKAPTESKPPAAAETNNKVKVLPKPGTSAQTLPATPVQPMASISEKLTSPIKIEGSNSNQPAITAKHSSSRSPSPKTSKTTNNPDRVLSTVTQVVNSNRMSPASTTAASSSRASTPTPVINSNRISPAPTTASSSRMLPAPATASSSRMSQAPTAVNSSQPISAPKSTQQSSSHGSSKSGTPPSTRSTRSSSSKAPTTAPTNGTSTKHSTTHPSSSKFAKIAHSSTITTNTLPTSSMTSSSSKNALKSSTSSTENNRGMENQSTATASNGIKRPRSPFTDAVVITAEVSPCASPTFERENDTDLQEPFLHSVHESELLQNVLPVVEVKEEGQEVECFRVEVLTELRTIRPSEYPLLDAVKFLESSKSSNSKKRKLNGTSLHGDTELVDSKVLEAVDFKSEAEIPKGKSTEEVSTKRIEVADLKLPCYAPVDNVTIIYGDSGQTSFIHENSQFPDGCDVSDDESTSILDIPKESLFDFSLHQDAAPNGIEIDQGPIFPVLPSELCTTNKFNLNSHPMKNGLKKPMSSAFCGNGESSPKKLEDGNVLNVDKKTPVEDAVAKPINGLVSYTPKDSCLYPHLMDLEDISDDELFPTNFMEKESESEEEVVPTTQVPTPPVPVAEADTPDVIESTQPKEVVEDLDKCSEAAIGEQEAKTLDDIPEGATTETLKNQEPVAEPIPQSEVEPTTDCSVTEDEFIPKEFPVGLQDVNLEPGKDYPYSPLQDEPPSPDVIPVKSLVLACIDTLSMDCEISDIPLTSGNSSPNHELKNPPSVHSLNDIESEASSPVHETYLQQTIPNRDECPERDVRGSPSPVGVKHTKGEEPKDSSSMETEELEAANEEQNSPDLDSSDRIYLKAEDEPEVSPKIQELEAPVEPETSAKVQELEDSVDQKDPETTQELEDTVDHKNPEETQHLKELEDSNAEKARELEGAAESTNEASAICADPDQTSFIDENSKFLSEKSDESPFPSPLIEESSRFTAEVEHNLKLKVPEDCCDPVTVVPLSPPSTEMEEDQEEEYESRTVLAEPDQKEVASPLQEPLNSPSSQQETKGCEANIREDVDFRDTAIEQEIQTMEINSERASIETLESQEPALDGILEKQIESSADCPVSDDEFIPQEFSLGLQDVSIEPGKDYPYSPMQDEPPSPEVSPVKSLVLACIDTLSMDCDISDIPHNSGKSSPIHDFKSPSSVPSLNDFESEVASPVNEIYLQHNIPNGEECPGSDVHESPLPVQVKPTMREELKDSTSIETEELETSNEEQNSPDLDSSDLICLKAEDKPELSRIIQELEAPVEPETTAKVQELDDISQTSVEVQVDHKIPEETQELKKLEDMNPKRARKLEDTAEPMNQAPAIFEDPDQTSFINENPKFLREKSDDISVEDPLIQETSTFPTEVKQNLSMNLPEDCDEPLKVVFMSASPTEVEEDMEPASESHITCVEPETVARQVEPDPRSPQEEVKACDADICEAIDSRLEIQLECMAKPESLNPIQSQAISPAEVMTDMDYSHWTSKKSDQGIQIQANMCPVIESEHDSQEDLPVCVNVPRSYIPLSPPIQATDKIENRLHGSVVKREASTNSSPTNLEVVPETNFCDYNNEDMDWEDASEPINISRTTQPICCPSVSTVPMTYPVPNTNNVERICGIEIGGADSDSSVELTMDCEETNDVSPISPQPGSGSEEDSEDPRSQLPPEAVAHSPISDAGSSELEMCALYNDPVYTLDKQQTSSEGSRSSPSPTSRVSSSDIVFSLPTENYPSQTPIQGMNDKNIRIIYATASAHAEEGDEEAGIPRKVRLLYAEALGYGGNAAEPLQLVYAAARPNQHFEDSDSRVVETMPARYVSTPPDWNYSGERVQEMFAQQKPTYSEPLSMEVVAGSGSAISQCYVDYPENLSLVSRAQNLPGLIPRSHIESQRDVMNAFQYGNLETSSAGDARASAYHDHSLYSSRRTGSYDGMSLLATAAAYRTAEERAVERANLAWDAADRARVTAAQAIATVGLAARLQREREIMERSNMTPSPSLSDNVPSPPSSEYNQGSGSRYHRGPRKHYLSQPRTD